MEEWKPTIGGYLISSYGRVKNPERLDNSGHNRKEKIIKPYITRFGYLRVNLYENGKRKNFHVHRLVALAFIPNPNNLPQVNHKDGNKHNNCFDNLEWCNQSENLKHAYKMGLMVAKLNNSKLSKQVLQYSLNGELICKYPSSKEVERQTGFKRTNICACCRGVMKTAYSYIWRYATAC